MARSIERVARNEAIFRDANERIEERLNELSLEDGRSPFLCECELESCTTVVRLSLGEYEQVREHPRRFFISPGHESESGHVVDETDRYQVVEKTGTAGEIACRMDRRTSDE
jgi:hypothetical protein